MEFQELRDHLAKFDFVDSPIEKIIKKYFGEDTTVSKDAKVLVNEEYFKEFSDNFLTLPAWLVFDRNIPKDRVILFNPEETIYRPYLEVRDPKKGVIK